LRIINQLLSLLPVISALCYWLVGYAVAYGEGNPFVGLTHWAGVGLRGHKMAQWFFQFVFAATAATLVSGAVAERCHFAAYITYSAVISGETEAILRSTHNAPFLFSA
jgi:Amt family ammonium transporter